MRQMDIVSLSGAALLSGLLCLVVRQYKPEAALWISLACGVLLLTAAVAMLAPSVEVIARLTSSAGIDSSYAQVLFKALAVCYITQLSADCCRDAGESAIASKLELAGKAAVLVISLPVFTALAELVTELLG